eukprot:9931013-Alexandrium_andersonii.AAC.1
MDRTAQCSANGPKSLTPPMTRATKWQCEDSHPPSHRGAGKQLHAQRCSWRASKGPRWLVVGKT